MKGGHFIDIKEDLKKPSVSDVIGHTLMSSGVNAAIEQYKQLKDEQSDKYDFSEPQLNELGYELIKNGMLSEAIEIFKLN